MQKRTWIIAGSAAGALALAGIVTAVINPFGRKDTITPAESEQAESDGEEAVEERKDVTEATRELVVDQDQTYVAGTPYLQMDGGVAYSVAEPHVILNQVFAGSTKYASAGFIELYNPTEEDVDLSGWSLQTRLSDTGEKVSDEAWTMHRLEGTIPAHSSYLVMLGKEDAADRAEEETSVEADSTEEETIDGAKDRNRQSDSPSAYDECWDTTLSTEGFTVVLLACDDLLEADAVVFDNYQPGVNYYVDQIAAAGKDVNTVDAISRTLGDYETELSSLDLETCAIRRNAFTDTDDNSLNEDMMVADYSFENEDYLSWISPRSSADADWEASDSPQYTVTYETKGGSALKKAQYDLYTCATKPDAPTKYMCVFDGWFTDSDCKEQFDFDSLPTGDLTLYAGWSENPNAEVVNRINQLRSTVDIYLNSYYTKESVDALLAVEAEIDSFDSEHATTAAVEAKYTALENAINGLVYQTGTTPRVYIATNDQIANTMVKSTGYVSSTIAVVGTDGSVVSEKETAQIKVRGNTTSEGLKKPYNIKFSEKQALLGLGEGKKWVLLADWFDPTMLRNTIALNLAKELGLAYTSEHQYVEVWIDGDYRGVYVLTEPVSDGATRVDLQKSNGEFLIMYEKERVDPDATYITTSKGYRFEIREPETPDAAQLANIQAVLNNFEAALDSGDYSRIEQCIDVDSFAKYFLVNEYCKNSDVTNSSVYFYYKGGKLYAGPVWDFDLSMGNSPVDRIASADEFRVIYAVWFQDLFLYYQFQQNVQQQYNAHRSYIASIYASGGEIDQLEASYGSLFKRNFSDTIYTIAMTATSFNRTPDATYSANVESLRSWLAERDSWLGSNLDNLVYCVRITGATGTESGNQITWTEVPGAEYYQVLRKNDAGTWDIIGPKVTGSSYLDRSAAVNVTYTYTVRAVKGSTYSYTFDTVGKTAARKQAAATNTPTPTPKPKQNETSAPETSAKETTAEATEAPVDPDTTEEVE